MHSSWDKRRVPRGPGFTVRIAPGRLGSAYEDAGEWRDQQEVRGMGPMAALGWAGLGSLCVLVCLYSVLTVHVAWHT